VARLKSAGRSAPFGVGSALVKCFGTVLAQMALQRAAIQEASGSSSGSQTAGRALLGTAGITSLTGLVAANVIG